MSYMTFQQHQCPYLREVQGMSRTLQVGRHVEGRQLDPQLRRRRRRSHLDCMSIRHTFTAATRASGHADVMPLARRRQQ